MNRRSVLKSTAEMRQMVPAGVATARALEAVRNACVAGVSTRELDRIAERVIRDHGGEPAFMRVPGYHHTICASVNSDVVHGIPSDQPLVPGDVVSIDCGAFVGGWNGDAAFTVVLDDPDRPDEVAKRTTLSTVTEQALWQAIACLAEARHLNEVGGVIEDYVRSVSDYGILPDYIGHGIGRDLHEDPPVFNHRVKGRGARVSSGLVVAIEPMIVSGRPETFVREDEWAVATLDGGVGAHWEHTVAVHSGGIWVLTAEDGGRAGLAHRGVTPVPIE